MMKRLFTVVLLFFFMAAPLSVCFPEAVGELSPSGLVNDYAGALSPSAEAQINALLEELRAKTGAEIAIVTVNTTSPLTIEQFAVELFEKWGIGQKGKDNGVLVLLAVKDRNVRIEVGYGLEGAITDAKSKIIINELMLPAFRQGNYDLGVAQGVVMLAKIVSSEYGVGLDYKSRGLPAPRGRAKKSSPLGSLLTLLFFILIFGFRFGTLFFFMSGGGGYWSRGGGGSFGGGFGGFGGGMSGGGGASGSW